MNFPRAAVWLLNACVGFWHLASWVKHCRIQLDVLPPPPFFHYPNSTKNYFWQCLETKKPKVSRLFRLEIMALYKSTLGSLNSVPGLKPQRQGARLNSIRSRSLNPTSWEETDISKWPLVPGAPTMAISTRGRLAVKDIVSVSLYCKKSVTLSRAILSLFFAYEHATQKHMKRVDGERIEDQEAIDKYTIRHGSRDSVWINLGPPRQPEGRRQNLVPPVCRADWSVPWLQTSDIIVAAREKRCTHHTAKWR